MWGLSRGHLRLVAASRILRTWFVIEHPVSAQRVPYSLSVDSNGKRRSYSSSQSVSATLKPGSSPSAFSRLFQPLARQAQVVRTALALYEACVHGVDYSPIYSACQMPDTLQSWFLVNSLHVWFCLVRLKPEGKNGRLVYKQLVEALWADVRQRLKAMGITSPTDTKKGIEQLSQQFFGLIVAFDEGLLSRDTVLASALWWNLFSEKDKSDPVAVAHMVNYVRSQVKHMDMIPSSSLFSDHPVTFLTFDQGVLPTSSS